MNTPLPHRPYSSLRWRSCAMAVLGAMLSAGCHRSVDFRASALPDMWRASPPLAQAIDPAQLARKSINSDLIYPGDVLEVSIATGIEERDPHSWSLRVTEEGFIDVPLVGSVPVAGLELPVAEQRIHQESIDRQIYVRPNVSLALKERHTINVRVVGEVEDPGTYPLPAAGADLLAALVAAGWLTEDAGTAVELRHPVKARVARGPDGAALTSFAADETTDDSVHVDLVEATLGHSPNHHVEDGTVVSVMKKPPPQVHVDGLVRKPDAYEISMDKPTRVLDVISKAGGRTLTMANKVHVLRQSEDGKEPITIHIPYNEAKFNSRTNLILQDGDVVTVEETPVTFVVDTLRNFFRVGISSAFQGF